MTSVLLICDFPHTSQDLLNVLMIYDDFDVLLTYHDFNFMNFSRFLLIFPECLNVSVMHVELQCVTDLW